MTTLGGGSQPCVVCKKTAYPKESVQHGVDRYHRSCFRCNQCQTALRANGFGTVEGKIYCLPHTEQLLDDSQPTIGGSTAGGGDSGDAATTTIVNRTGGIEVGGQMLFGMDAETALKRQANYDLGWELEVRSWIDAVLGAPLEGETLGDSLMDGIALCNLLNKIKPGTINKINKRAIPLMQLENIKLYLDGCWRLGVPSGSLFSSSDLFKQRDMAAVLQNLQALGRVAQGIDTFGGPHYGQKVSKSTSSSRHKPVEAAYLTKKFVHSGETADSQELRSQLVKLEEKLQRERFKSAHLEEQLKAGGIDADAGAAGTASALREQVATLREAAGAAAAAQARAERELERLQASAKELAAELDWERQKESRITPVTIKTVDGEGGESDGATLAELRDECHSLQQAVKMLGSKRKSDVKKIREIRDSLDKALAELETATARVAALERQLAGERERGDREQQRADALMAKLSTLASRDDDDDDDDGGVGGGSRLEAEAAALEAEAAALEAEALLEQAAEMRDLVASLLGAPKDAGGALPSVDWLNEPLVDGDDVRELAAMFDDDGGRRLFVRALADTLAAAPSKALEPQPFELLCDILHALLSAMSSGAVDVISARVVMQAAGQLHVPAADGADERYVQERIRGHALWSIGAVWEDMFFEELLQKHRERGPAQPVATAAADTEAAVAVRGNTLRRVRASARAATGATPDDHSAAPATADDIDDDEAFELDGQLLVNVLGRYVNKMGIWGCDIQTIEAFVDTVCEQTELPKAYYAAIQSKLRLKQQVARMQEERQQKKKQRRRTRAESLLTPVKSLRRGGANAGGGGDSAAPPKPEK